jgi:hypothetical protein
MIVQVVVFLCKEYPIHFQVHSGLHILPSFSNDLCGDCHKYFIMNWNCLLWVTFGRFSHVL